MIDPKIIDLAKKVIADPKESDWARSVLQLIVTAIEEEQNRPAHRPKGRFGPKMARAIGMVQASPNPDLGDIAEACGVLKHNLQAALRNIGQQ